MPHPDLTAVVPPTPSGPPSAQDVVRHAGELLGFLSRHLGDRAVAAELLQDVLVRAFTRLHEVRGADHVRPWLFRIAVNRFNDYLRREKPRRTAAAPADPVDQNVEASPERTALRHEVEDVLRRAVADLPERQREVVLLHGVEGFDQTLIAARLGLTTGAVKTALYHGREKLRAVLGRYLGFDPGRTGDRR